MRSGIGEEFFSSGVQLSTPEHRPHSAHDAVETIGAVIYMIRILGSWGTRAPLASV